MEMQLQNLPSVDISTAPAASHDPNQLIFSLSCSSTSSSDLISAPLDTSSSLSTSTSPSTPSAPSHPPPAADPQQPHAGSQHCSIAILPSEPAITPRSRPLPYGPPKEEVWKSLGESIPHSMRLSQLHKSEWGFQKEARSHKKLMGRHSKDLFMVVSIYALLQGAIFTAVAQSSIFTCTDWWGPAAIVGAVTFGTVFSALDKLRRMEYERQEVKNSEIRRNAVYDKIQRLYTFGSSCEIESLEPAHEGVLNNKAGSMCIYSVRGLLVLGFLLSFSALMMSCMRMLTCNPCRCGQ